MSLNTEEVNVDITAVEVAELIGEYLTREEFVPINFISELDDRMGIFKGKLKTAIHKIWQEKNSSLDLVKQKELRMPIRIMNTIDRSTPEEKLRLFLPEEKIIFNQKTFRSILSGTDFDTITPQMEKQLVVRLKTEAIGLSEQEVLIYYNLIKWSEKANKPKQQYMLADNSDTDNIQVHAAEVVTNLEKHFISLDRISYYNENRHIPPDFIATAIINRVENNIVPIKALRLITGSYEDNKAFHQFIKNYVVTISNNWGVVPDETMSYFLFLLLFLGANHKIITSDHLSRTFQKFILEEAGRIKSVIIANIKYLYLFTTILASQVIEINKKYIASPADQKEKILKLYSSQERLQMVIANASNYAIKKVECAKLDLFDVTKNIKFFHNRISTLLTSDTLFKSVY